MERIANKFKGLVINYAYSTERISFDKILEYDINYLAILSLYVVDEETGKKMRLA